LFTFVGEKSETDGSRKKDQAEKKTHSRYFGIV